MKNYKFGVVVVVFALAACGGGGGGGSEPTTGPATSNPPASGSNLRILKEGDQWLFDLTIVDSSAGLNGSGTFEVVLSGTYTNTHGKKCINAATSLVASAAGQTITASTKSVAYQDSDGALYNCGDYVGGAAVVEVDSADGLSKELPSPLQVGLVHSYLTTLKDGSWTDCTVRVEAFEKVNTPAGSFDAYRAKETCSESDGTSYIDTQWISPSHFLVKEQYQEDSETDTMVLKSFSFAP